MDKDLEDKLERLDQATKDLEREIEQAYTSVVGFYSRLTDLRKRLKNVSTGKADKPRVSSPPYEERPPTCTCAWSTWKVDFRQQRLNTDPDCPVHGYKVAQERAKISMAGVPDWVNEKIREEAVIPETVRSAEGWSATVLPTDKTIPNRSENPRFMVEATDFPAETTMRLNVFTYEGKPYVRVDHLLEYIKQCADLWEWRATMADGSYSEKLSYGEGLLRNLTRVLRKLG